MDKRVTIQDIADSLGLSRNTVSKALNGADGLADATRDRVLQRAVEMGYKQFAYVQTMIHRQGESQDGSFLLGEGDKREIALFTTTYLSPPHFSSLMLDAFQSEISQLGLTLNTHRVTAADLYEKTLPRSFDASRVAAIICIEMFDWDYDKMVCSLGIPTLFVDGPSRFGGEYLPCDQLYMENTTQVTRLVNDMLGQGVKSIGFIGNWEHCQSFYERYTAFRLAMLMRGVPVNERHCIQANARPDVMMRVQALETLPELFICANDFIAIDALAALRMRGLDVPKDILIAGFDDSAESRRSIPQLTTIHIHTQIMAFSAIQLLQSRIKEPSLDYRQVYTETELIYRESTALPR